MTCRRTASGEDEVEAVQLLGGEAELVQQQQQQYDCRVLEEGAERDEGWRGGAGGERRSAGRTLGGRERDVDGTDAVRSVELFVHSEPRWDPRGEHRRFRVAFGDG